MIYLMRHGEALSERQDPLRGLTDFGKDEVMSKCSLFKDRIEISKIYHSPLKRAQQTAKIIADQINNIELIESKLILPESSVVDAKDFINLNGDGILYVTHLPFVAALTNALSAKYFEFRPSTIIAIDYDSKRTDNPIVWSY